MAAGLKVGDVLCGRYTIEGILGEGGMGAVYQASDLSSPRQWAIKELSNDFEDQQELQEAIALFQAEANLLAQLRHDNLPSISHVFSEGDRQYLVMDLISGPTLEKYLAEHHQLSLPMALDFADQISMVLEYLHTRPTPIIFRDLKPANIILSRSEQKSFKLMLIDFGIARFFKKDNQTDTQALGTPGYAAPEQYGAGQSDARTDIYALGAVMHEMLTGISPSQRVFYFAPLREVCPQAPQALADLIAKAVQVEPNSRFASIAQFRQALQSLGSMPETYTILPQRLRTGLLPPPKVSAFTPEVLHFGHLESGVFMKTIVGLTKPLAGEAVTSAQWLSTTPRYLVGQEKQLMVCVDTSYLSNGGTFSGSVRVGSAELQVDVEVEASSVGWWIIPLAIFCTVLTMLPIAGLVPLLAVWIIYARSPLHLKGKMLTLAIIASVLTVLAVLLTAAVGGGILWLVQYDWSSLWESVSAT